MSEAAVQYAHPPIAPEAACVACGGTGRLERDHCHDHGWVRGIVCRSCNRKLLSIDRRFAPRVDEKLLLALLAVRNSCPDCGQLGPADLVPLKPPAPKKPRPISIDGKGRENRLRRWALDQGYRLEKSRRRDPRAKDYGTYRLTSAKGKPKDFPDIDAVERFLSR